MSEPLRPDLCILGASTAGLALAVAAAGLGVPTVLIEPGDLAQARLHEGWLPAAALRAAARASVAVQAAPGFGIVTGGSRTDFVGVQRHVRDVLERFAVADSEARLKALGVRVLRAQPTFTGPDRLEADGLTVLARRFVLALRPEPPCLSLPRVASAPVLTPAGLHVLTELPDRLAVVGASPAGLSLAQSFARLGSRVTLIDMDSGSALASEDPEMAEIVLRALRGDGVDLRQNALITAVEPEGSGWRLTLGGETISATYLLVATAPVADLNGLDLAAAGVACDAGVVRTGPTLRTSNPRVFAMGAAAGGRLSAHAAEYQAGIVLRSAIFRLPVRPAPTAVPRLVLTDPEWAVAGLDEVQARSAGHAVEVHRWSFAETERSRAERIAGGHIKIVSARGRLLGAAIVGPCASELIGLWQLAVDRRMKVTDLAGLALPSPSFGEVSRRAALSFYGARLRRSWLGSALRLLRRLG